MSTLVLTTLINAEQFAGSAAHIQRGQILFLSPFEKSLLSPYGKAVAMHALEAAIPLLARRFAPNLRVNMICSGPALAAITRPAPAPHNCARLTEAIRYVLAAGAMTGQVLAIDM